MESERRKGVISGVQRFAIHDGPGIRTLVYMKGCPLSCLWCSTPQAQKMAPEILYIDLYCKQSGSCVATCPVGAITLSEEAGVKIDRELCRGTGQCAEACPNRALKLVGYHVTVGELFPEVAEDSPFYRRSNGGVTVGGGEPTTQPGFVAQFLKRCKQHSIHTAMETCGCVEWGHLERLLQHLDLVYFDIKHMDGVVHKELTGLSNELILENARRACAVRPTIVRIPIVPGLNDSNDNISATARFVSELGENLKRIELLPYHKYGTQTYGQLGRGYELPDVQPPPDDDVERLKEIVESCGVTAQIGG